MVNIKFKSHLDILAFKFRYNNENKLIYCSALSFKLSMNENVF
jgi:hypothetical protein